MNLLHLKDKELLEETKRLTQTERHILTKILHHLREIDRRKLYCDLGYQSLFDYAVKELKYSEGQAGRRIQAMRLIKEIPQVEKSIASGELSLTNIAQAQSLFRTVAKENPSQKMSATQKIDVINSLKNKSSREGQKELLRLQPNVFKLQEKERQVTDEIVEVRFVMNDNLKQKLEQVRTLLGPLAVNLSYAELFLKMAELSVESLQEKKFGKKRAHTATENLQVSAPTPAPSLRASEQQLTPALELRSDEQQLTPALELLTPSPTSKNNRYIPKKVQHLVWLRDKGKCSNCGSKTNLNIDHIKPIALGGTSVLNNLRLLCFHCNQRAAMKAMGVNWMEDRRRKS